MKIDFNSIVLLVIAIEIALIYVKLGQEEKRHDDKRAVEVQKDVPDAPEISALANDLDGCAGENARTHRPSPPSTTRG